MHLLFHKLLAILFTFFRLKICSKKKHNNTMMVNYIMIIKEICFLFEINFLTLEKKILLLLFGLSLFNFAFYGRPNYEL